MIDYNPALVITDPINDHLVENSQNNISNSSTTSRESLQPRYNKPPPPPPQETFNNMISNRFKKRWKKSKKSAPPPPPPNLQNDNERVTQVTTPMVHNLLPNGYALGGGKDKQESVGPEVKPHDKLSTLTTNDIQIADTELSMEQFHGDNSLIGHIENERLDGKDSYEIIGTRREVLDEELLVDLRDLDQTKVNENNRPEDREPFPASPLNEGRRASKQVS